MSAPFFRTQRPKRPPLRAHQLFGAYREDARGNVLVECGCCKTWTRVTETALITLGRFIRKWVEDPETGEETAVWIVSTQNVGGCKDCQSLMWEIELSTPKGRTAAILPDDLENWRERQRIGREMAALKEQLARLS